METESESDGDDASVIPADWIGYSLGASPPSIEYIGHAEVSDYGPDLAAQFGSGGMVLEGDEGDAELDVIDPDVLV
jgi:hypothetical protein